MSAAREPQDQAVRARVTTDFGTTLLLEAGAGSGKTTVLVERILAILLGGHATLDRIVAITFTDKAAGELKGRLRDGIEEALEAATANGKDAEATRLARARDDLERAPVSTIHAFAASLLRERPFEAGLDPGFAVAADVASDRTFEDAWSDWLHERMKAGDPALVRAMACGLTLDALRQAARVMTSERDVLGLAQPAPPFSIQALLDRLSAAVTTLAALRSRCRDTGDRAYEAILDLEADLKRAGQLDDASRERFLRELTVSAHLGQKGNWKPPSACDDAKAELRAVKEAIAAFCAASDAHVAWSLRDCLRGFLDAYERAKADAAVVDFQDLLLRTRDLLLHAPSVRRSFQQRFDFILIDEFQDTDPLQVEIAFLLAEDPNTGPAADWRSVTLAGGKLFLVGDPKQSIYRFRRAEIGLYQEAKRLVQASGGEVLALDTCFRTVPSIVGFVNELFEDVFTDPALDPDPLPLAAHRPEVDRDGARTIALPVPPERLPQDGRRTLDVLRPAVADTVAAFLREITQRRPWSIRHGDSVRPARPGDVALLVRKTTPEFLGPVERALTANGVPYRIVGGKEYFVRDEVSALRSVLRAIDNPADRLALFAALRSPFFAFSDDDLWQFVASGGSLSYQAPLPAAARNLDLIAPAFEILKRLHRLRRVRPPSDVIVELFARTRALAGFRLRPGGDQIVANLWKTLDVARAYEAAGPTTLRAVVRFLEEEAQGGGGEGDSPVGEEIGAQVAIVTVHSAKGLEYPIVVLGDIHSAQRPGREVVVDHASQQGWLKVGGFKPLGWDEANQREAQQADAEERRLLYVALTRAKDHLVIPCLPGEPMKGWAAAATSALLQPGVPTPYGARVSPMRAGGTKRGRATVSVFDSAALRFDPAREETEARNPAVDGGDAAQAAALEAEKAWAAGVAVRAEEPIDDEPSDGAEGDALSTASALREPDLGEGASAFGSLVHKLLELPEPQTIVSLEAAALVLNGEFQLRRADLLEAVSLALRTRQLPAVASAAAADVVYRERPFTCRLDGQLVTGRIDLAYRRDGAWTLIDFKTARLSGVAEAKVRYGEQLQRYRRALSLLTGEPVGSAVCLVRTAELVGL